MWSISTRRRHSENADMPILNLLAYPRNKWPDRLLDVMHDPAGDGALYDAIEADKQGRSGNAVEYHLRSSKRQLKSRETWRFFTVGYVLILTLARAEAGEKHTSVNAAMSEVKDALGIRVKGYGAGLTELYASWRAFRPVAHLWAAQSMCSCPMKELEPPAFLEWIAGAEDLRRRGEAFRPPKAKTPVLDPSTTWKMPDELKLPPMTVPLPSVDEIILKIITFAEN